MSYTTTLVDEPEVDPQTFACRNLIAAVMERAIRDLLGSIETCEDRVVSREVFEWFFAELPEAPMSFSWCCKLMGYNKSAIRRGVINVIKERYERANVNNPALAQQLCELCAACEKYAVRNLLRRQEEANQPRDETTSKL